MSDDNTAAGQGDARAIPAPAVKADARQLPDSDTAKAAARERTTASRQTATVVSRELNEARAAEYKDRITFHVEQCVKLESACDRLRGEARQTEADLRAELRQEQQRAESLGIEVADLRGKLRTTTIRAAIGTAGVSVGSGLMGYGGGEPGLDDKLKAGYIWAGAAASVVCIVLVFTAAIVGLRGSAKPTLPAPPAPPAR